MSSDDPQLDVPTRSSVEQRADALDVLVPGLTILLHPDLDRVGERVVLAELAAGRTQALSRLEPAFAAPRGRGARPLAHPYLSRTPLTLTPLAADGVLVARAGCAAPVVIDGQALAHEHRLSAEAVQRGVVITLARRVVLLLHRLDALAPGGTGAHGLVGESRSVNVLRQEIERVARTNVPVLVRGESGSGKELVAAALHAASPRRAKPYVTVNAAALPAGVAAAELFGAARGAFTGADRQRSGYFMRAHGGTLFLDEIAEVGLDVQALLLRVLETQELQVLGGERSERVDVRVVAATDADLEEAVRAGRFRAPLLARLRGYELRLPPLRARRDDIGRLLLHFLALELRALGAAGRLAPRADDARPWLPAALVARLAAHDWPGNVRELRNVARHVAVQAFDLDEVPEHLHLPDVAPPAHAAMLGAPRPAPVATPLPVARPGVIHDDELLTQLRAHGFRVADAARALGISRGALYALIERSTVLRKASALTLAEIQGAQRVHGDDPSRLAAALEVSPRGLRRRMGQLGLLAR
jgi:two-component system nitrogen regulation response regulator GlnG